MTIEQTKKKIYFPSLNGLRAISILLVIFSHLKWANPALRSFLYEYVPLLADGQIGVNIFFIISGFLITSLLIDEESRTNNISLSKFYIRRIIRIFPAYYSLLFFYLLLTLWGTISFSNESWLTSVTYTKYFNWKVDLLSGHLWSLSVEEHYYLLFPILFLFKSSRKYFIFLALLLAPLFRIYSFLHPNSFINEGTFFCRIDSIAIGCLFALYKTLVLNLLKEHFKTFFYLSVILLLSFSYLSFLNVKYNLHFGYFLIPFGGTYGSLTNFFLIIIIFYSVFETENNWFRFLNLKFMNYIGLLSYSIYLWQQFFLDPKNYFSDTTIVNIMFIVIFSLFSYYVIEKNFLKLRGRFTS